MARTDRMVREFAVEAEWVPFELHPEIPADGFRRDERRPLMNAEVRAHLKQVAEESDLQLVGNPIMANSHNALAATEWARDQGGDAFDKLHRALFGAYFADQRNISTIAEIVSVAEEQGLDGAALGAVLEARRYSDRVAETTKELRERSVHSTPSFLFEDRYMIMGAQDFETFADVLTRLGVPRRA